MVHFDINLSHWIAQDQAKELEKEVKAEVFRAWRRIGVTSRDAFTQTDSKKKFVAQVTHCYQRIFDGLCDEPGPVQVGCDPTWRDPLAQLARGECAANCTCGCLFLFWCKHDRSRSQSCFSHVFTIPTGLPTMVAMAPTTGVKKDSTKAVPTCLVITRAGFLWLPVAWTRTEDTPNWHTPGPFKKKTLWKTLRPQPPLLPLPAFAVWLPPSPAISNYYILFSPAPPKDKNIIVLHSLPLSSLPPALAFSMSLLPIHLQSVMVIPRPPPEEIVL